MVGTVYCKRTALDGLPSYSLKHRLFRGAWRVTWLVFASWTPSGFRLWRVFLLRLFGAKIIGQVDVRASARVWYPPNLIMEDRTILASRVVCYNMAPVRVGRGSIVSQGAFLCGGTHDVDSINLPLVTKPITIEEECWIAAEAFVGPGVTLGQGAVLGARSVCFQNLDSCTIYVGNPARPIRRRLRRAIFAKAGIE